MSNNMIKNSWLIGAGQMAVDYHKVLTDFNMPFNVIGRGKKSAKKFTEKTKMVPITGGLENFLLDNPTKCSHAIVAVGVENLAENTKKLLRYGIQNILVEKPAGLNKEEIKEVKKIAKEKKANVYVAYNRRFYASVIKAKEIIKKDGGVTSFNFEFTEWSHTIEKLEKAPGVKENWFLGNSTHVVDLAFHLGGKPKDIATFVKGSIDWHPSSSIFSGAGISISGALFSYQANWESAGRWSVEILTNKNRLILCPLEELKIQKRGSIKKEIVLDIDYSLDENFKAGLYIQTKKFLNNEYKDMIDISSFNDLMLNYYNIANYKV